jgi:hypothetical protein
LELPLPEYTVMWSRGVVHLPPARNHGAERDGFIAAYSHGEKLFRQHVSGSSDVARVPVRLIPRPDNDYNQWAVSIAGPPKGDASIRDRQLGFLYDSYLEELGQETLHDLARYSSDGEIRCHARVESDGSLRSLALPEPSVLRRIVQEFIRDPRTPHLDTLPSVSDLTGLNLHGVVQTKAVLRDLGRFPERSQRVGPLVVTTRREGTDRPRSLHIADAKDGRGIGEIVNGWLFLEDERDREHVLARLAEQGVPVIGHARAHARAKSKAWDHDRVPNAVARRRHASLDFRAVPEAKPHHALTFARFNPTTRILFVEASELVPPACVFAARMGLNVKAVKVPQKTWRTEREFEWHELQGEPLGGSTLEEDPWVAARPVRPDLYTHLSSLLPRGILGKNDVTWTARPPAHGTFNALVEDNISILEPLVSSRETLFPEHEPTGRFTPCRLCGRVATEFTVRGCTSPLAYCHACLESAERGIGNSRDRAIEALRLLTRQEFSGIAPMELQLARVHLDAAGSTSSDEVDVRVLARFALPRRAWPWTRMLVDAKLLPVGGLRMARGTVLDAADGHLCLSMQEKVVDDFFHHHNIDHDREPHYPYDEVLNPRTRRRADWILSNGTLVELWGLPDDPAYAARMTEKRELAAKYGISLVELSLVDLPRLPTIFRSWVRGAPPAATAWTPPQPAARARQQAAEKVPRDRASLAHNGWNDAQRAERLERGRRALALQASGMTRSEISKSLGLGADTVKDLLSDAKFYQDPAADPERTERARAASDARAEGLTRAAFQAAQQLSSLKAKQAWRDADTVHPPSAAQDNAT